MLTMTIGGTAVSAASSFDVEDPATGEVIGQAPECTLEQLDAAVTAATAAFPAWARDESFRREVLHRAGAVIEANAREIGELITAEQGKPLAKAVLEARGAAKWFAYHADLEIPIDVIRDDPRCLVEVVRRPIGPVAAVTAWNYPVTQIGWKVPPALLAGNTVVLKPSPFTPLSTLRVGELLNEVLPPGVCNVVSGTDAIAPALTGHAAIRKVTFTGSAPTGRRIAHAVADDFKRMTLEMGGNDGAIVLDDIDVGAMAERIFWGAFENSGQICAAIKRLYVPERMLGEMVDALASIADGLVVGPGADPATDLGPISTRPQLERVSELVDEAIAAGARVATREVSEGRNGNLYPPTVLTRAGPGMRIVDEEQFGPVLPVLPYRDLDEAIAQVNATTYGLGGSVWGSDPNRADLVARRLDCGTVWVNAHAFLAPWQPFGGVKWSSVGVENGPWGLSEYSDLQVVHRAR